MIHVFHGTKAVVSALQLLSGADASAMVQQNVKDYVHVAEVMVEEPEKAIQLTTHSDSNWWEHDKVHSDLDIGLTLNARSTSQGDLLIKDDDAYLVTSDGLTKLDGGFKVLDA